MGAIEDNCSTLQCRTVVLNCSGEQRRNRADLFRPTSLSRRRGRGEAGNAKGAVSGRILRIRACSHNLRGGKWQLGVIRCWWKMMWAPCNDQPRGASLRFLDALDSKKPQASARRLI